jgi:6-linalyl-2-O,3-dimethylflaviolin/7-geranyloxy-5-hydroxy-2-methoxy-3-methylnaphthalene-1,4-dione synthase
MSRTVELADLYSAIEESARLLDVACSRDKVWPILTTYGDTLPLSKDALMFRVATGARHAGELDCRITMLPKDIDPYGLALSNGLTTKTDHPVGVLLSDIQGRCPIDSYGIDFGVVGGFTKIWSFFPADDKQGLSMLADIPSMPRSLAENGSLFARHGLGDKSSLIGIDYQHKTMNVYFTGLPAECREPKTILSMLREIELPNPSEQMLKLGQKAFAIYFTLNWDSSKIERICFAVMTPDPMTLPVRLEPKIEQFVRNVPHGADHSFVYGAVASPDGEYYKLSHHTSGLTHRVERQVANVNAG